MPEPGLWEIVLLSHCLGEEEADLVLLLLKLDFENPEGQWKLLG